MRTNPNFNRIVWPLAISQTLSWAGLFYTFPALLLEWERDLGWSKVELSGGLTACLLLSALFAPLAGRIIDQGNFVSLHVGSTTAGAGLLVALSQVTELWQFYMVWSLLGITMAGALYEPCFAILTRTFEKRARAAITRVTLFAGFAGTIAFPLAHVLIEAFGWRITVITFAAIILTISVPLAWFATREAQAHIITLPSEPEGASHKTFGFVRTFAFWGLAVTYFAISVDHSIIITHMLPLLEDRGVAPASAILAAAFIGPTQVAGRLAMMTLENKVSTIALAFVAIAALMLGATALLWARWELALVIVFVVLHGAGNGINSIVRPLLTAQLLGRKNFGLISGITALPFIGGVALGPSIGALIWQQGGYDKVLLFAISMCALGFLSLLLARKFAKPSNS